MASVGEEELDYESDPEETKMSLTMMRRREASDDEDEEEDVDGEERVLPPRRTDSRAGIVSDYESDGQGAPAEYDEDESEIEEAEELEVEGEEENVYEDAVEVIAVGEAGEEFDGRRFVTEVQGMDQAEEKKENEDFVVPTVGELYANDDQHQNNDGGREEEKKENEPFAVPTAGAFYMHDDRFRDSAGGRGRHRRTLGGRKLWESKDNRKWGHDKFEEMTMEESHNDEGRRVPRGRYRGRGKNIGEDRGFPRGNKSKVYNNNNQKNAARSVRGRGPKRYQPSFQNNSEAPTQNRQPGKSVEKTSYASSGRVSAPTSKGESDPVSSRKHVFASSLSSASPPFYPSGSSSKEITWAQKRDAQAAPVNRNLRSSVTDERLPLTQSNALRGKNVADSISMDKLYIDDSISIPTGKPLTNLQLPPPVSSLINSTESTQSKVHGRGLNSSGQMSYQTALPLNQFGRVSLPTQLQNVQRPPVQNRFQPSLQAESQQLGQRPGSGSHASSPPKTALTINSFESGEVESLLELSKPKSTLVGKGKGSVQSNSGRSSFPYGGAQVMGAAVNMGGGHGDQNFPATPAFLPVMQFGGQHPGGVGVPAVGMAFPGYVAQPQHGLGKSEMTWLPVLAGAAGALGATYCSPYLTVDGAYHTASGQTSSLAAISSKENNASKPGNELKPSQRLELANDEFGQRQNKPRRYTEMKFDQ